MQRIIAARDVKTAQRDVVLAKVNYSLLDGDSTTKIRGYVKKEN